MTKSADHLNRSKTGSLTTLPMPWLLRGVNQRYRVEVTRQLAADGLDDLPQPGIWALMAIASGITEPNQLVSRMGVSKQAVSKLLDRLVVAEFVDRRSNPDDRRRTEITLTAKGRRAISVIDAAVDKTERAITAELGTESFEHLRLILEQLGNWQAAKAQLASGSGAV